MDMLRLLGALGIGIAVGLKTRHHLAFLRGSRRVLRICVGVLLLVMGAQLAQSRDRWGGHLALLGSALGSVLLLGCVFFAAFAVWRVFGRWRGRPLAVATPSDVTPGAATHELAAVGLNGACLVVGFLAVLGLPPQIAVVLPLQQTAPWLLGLLLLGVGIDLGAELHHLDVRALPKLLWFSPLLNLGMTLGSAACFCLLTRFSLRESLLVHSGMGWYSLSSIILGEHGLALLSVAAFLHNVGRELLSILTAPVAARLSPYLPVFLGGATSMDVMLPFVQTYSGRPFTLVSFYSGMILSLAVPSLVNAFLP